MEISFKGKHVLVTGAGKGIGRSIAIALWRGGAYVKAVSRTLSHLEDLKQEYPDIDIYSVDMADWESTRKLIKSLGPIDALVNNAAISQGAPFLEVTSDTLDRLFNVNVKAVINVSQIVVESLIKRNVGGTIVNISSQASMAALADHTAYSATKGALDSVTRVMALELGKHNIRVNCVNPTVIMTDMGRRGWSDPKKAEGMLSKIPLGRFGEVDEVVDAVLFLLSDRSSMINGVTLPVDGGFLAC